jgi:hypothetical protein
VGNLTITSHAIERYGERVWDLGYVNVNQRHHIIEELKRLDRYAGVLGDCRIPVADGSNDAIVSEGHIVTVCPNKSRKLKMYRLLKREAVINRRKYGTPKVYMDYLIKRSERCERRCEYGCN